MRKYSCNECTYVYSPALGDSDAGLDAWTDFDTLDEYWTCPHCGAEKDAFSELTEEPQTVIDPEYPDESELAFAPIHRIDLAAWRLYVQVGHADGQADDVLEWIDIYNPETDEILDERSGKNIALGKEIHFPLPDDDANEYIVRASWAHAGVWHGISNAKFLAANWDEEL